MNPEPIVFVVDDDEAILHSLQLLIESVGMQARTFPSATRFLESYQTDQAGCVIADIRMPGMSGLEMQAHLSGLQPSPPVIFLTGHGDIATAARAMRAGAVDFLEKPFSSDLLLERIRDAIKIDATRREKHALRIELAARFSQLTPRENQVMGLVVDGLSNRQIAAELKLSEKTVEAHRAAVMEKTQAGSLAQLVRMAVVLQDSPAPARRANGAA